VPRPIPFPAPARAVAIAAWDGGGHFIKRGRISRVIKKAPRASTRSLNGDSKELEVPVSVRG